MDQGKTVKKIFESKREGNRRRVRPRWRWWENLKKALRELRVKE